MLNALTDKIHLSREQLQCVNLENESNSYDMYTDSHFRLHPMLSVESIFIIAISALDKETESILTDDLIWSRSWLVSKVEIAVPDNSVLRETSSTSIG